jgi:hypothetical protein
MTTATYQALTEQQKREVRMYGVTVAGMREAVEGSLGFRFASPAMYAMSLMSNAQEEIEHDMKEDARQSINRAKWILATYIMERQ